MEMLDCIEGKHNVEPTALEVVRAIGVIKDLEVYVACKALIIVVLVLERLNRHTVC